MKSLPCLLFILALPAFAQNAATTENTTGNAGPAAPCSSEAHRQFDFWVGRWTVTTGGQPAGKNHIELLHNDCVLAEHWTSAQGNFSGSSLNIYDAATGHWHQTWTDSGGTLLLLDGGLKDGKMVLEGQGPGPNGATVTHRISWTPNADGTVRQHWESRTGEADWTTLFDGLYTHAEPSE
jgi:hypothetical protein